MLLLSPGALPLPPGAGEGAGKGVGEGEGPAAGEGQGASAANKRAYMPKKGVHGLETCTSSLDLPEQLAEAHRCTREPRRPTTLMLPAAGERKAHALQTLLTTLPSLLCVHDAQSG